MRFWSAAIPYDLSRTPRTASVPKSLQHVVPKEPGTYVIFKSGQKAIGEAILDIGECGPRPNSIPAGLMGRLASNCPHSASERIALDVLNGALDGTLRVTWITTQTKVHAKSAHDALISLFRRDFGRQPPYNARPESSLEFESFEASYGELTALVMDS